MNVVLYARYSSDNQREESIEAQIKAMTDFCKKNKWVVINTYTDEAISGTAADKRPGFLQMIKDSERKLFQSVIVHKLDRFARNRYDSAIYKKKLKDHGVRVVSVLEYLDDSPESTILESVLEGMAEYYSKNLSRETKKGLNVNASKAQFNGGTPPLGFEVNVEKKYVINEKEAVVVREIFDLYLQGIGYAKIAQILNEKGYVNKKGLPFAKTSIRDLLINEKYTEKYVYNKDKTRGRHRNFTGEEVVIEDAFPAIISKEIFNRVQSKFSEGQRGVNPNSKTTYFLTSFLECGECGGKYGGGGTKPGKSFPYYVYECSTRKRTKSQECHNTVIRKDLLETYVFRCIFEKILNPDRIEILSKEIVEYAKKKAKPQESEISKYKKSLTVAEAKLSKLLDAYLEGTLPREIYTGKSYSIKAEIENYKNLINELQNKQFSVITKEKVKNYLNSFLNYKSEYDENAKLKIIHAFVYKVIITREDVEIILKMLPHESFVLHKKNEPDTLSDSKSVVEKLVPRAGIEPA